jgi:hypothetical protein
VEIVSQGKPGAISLSSTGARGGVSRERFPARKGHQVEAAAMQYQTDRV